MKTNDSNYFLKPSDFFLTRKPMIIKTVLGSCVAITMFCKRTETAAVCHAMLPSCEEDNACRNGICRDGICQQRYKYVKCVIPEMIRRFNRLNIDALELEVKLFGGADMFNSVLSSRTVYHVGTRNIIMARQIISKYELLVKNLDVGGAQGRKIFFNTQTGEVWLKRLYREDIQACVEQAQAV